MKHVIIPGQSRELTEEQGKAEAIKFFLPVSFKGESEGMTAMILRDKTSTIARLICEKRLSAIPKFIRNEMNRHREQNAISAWYHSIGAKYDHGRNCYVVQNGIEAI